MENGNRGNGVVEEGEPDVGVESCINRVKPPIWVSQLAYSMRQTTPKNRRNGSGRRRSGSDRRRVRSSIKVNLERRKSDSSRRTGFGRRCHKKITVGTVQNDLVKAGFSPASVGIRTS